MIDASTLPPQCRRVLIALRAEGSRGIDRTQFALPVVYDGGLPIINFPGRIQDLEEKHGCVIGTPSRRHGNCVVYVLHSEPSARVMRPAHRVLDDDGFARAFACRRCLGILKTAGSCCGTSYRVAVPHDQALTGCLRIPEQEVRNAA